MSYAEQVWYCNAGDQSTTGYYAVTKWATGATIAAGALRRQNATPAVGSERVFVCVVAGTTHATTEPTWVLTRGAKTTDNTVTWQECTGASAFNGDLTNTPNWTAQKALGAPSLGSIIKRNNNASYQICTTVGSMAASEPAFSDTAGVTTSDGTSVWTSLGAVSNFTGGQAPFARLASVFGTSWWAATNTVYVGDNHAESQATAITISPANMGATVNKILCHNHSGSYPPAAGDLTTGASISTTAAVNINLTWTGGSIYLYGLAFKVGVGQSTNPTFILLNTLNSWTYFDNCSLQIAGTFTNQYIQFSSSNNACTFILNNTTVFFGNIGQKIDLQQVQFNWQNTGQVLAAGSAVPNVLIQQSVSGQNRNVILEALDLSQINTTIFIGIGGFGAAVSNQLLKDCKLNASAAIATSIVPGEMVQLVRCDSGATGYKSARYSFDGTETTETSVTRTGGATDPTGQAQSRKIATTANSQWLRPFKAEPYAIWNPTTGANVTVAVYGIANDTAVPNNDDVWMETEYLGSSAAPLGTIVNTTKASVLAANAAGTADTSAWDANVTARANSHAYVVGDTIKVASNPGRVFFNISGSGTSAGSEPGGYATAVDGGTVTDGSITFRAGCRFKLTKTLSSPQPGLAAFIEARVRAAKASTTFYFDPQIVLS